MSEEGLGLRESLEAAVAEPTQEPAGDLAGGAPQETAPPEDIGSGEGTDPQLYSVTIDGQEVQVTLDEALKGYQRQADYTRKTQELADARRLWQAIESDPETTLARLVDAYGLDLQGGGGAPAEQEELDPEEQFRVQVEQFMAEARQAQLQAQIDRQLADLHASFGEFDDTELIRFAVENQIGDLDKAYKAYKFEEMVEGIRKQRDEQATAERKAATPPVAGGHGVAAAAVTPGTGPASDVRDALRQAVTEAGVASDWGF